jgi:hypothetical protein
MSAGSAAGVATVAGVGKSVYAGAGASAGVATATGDGDAVIKAAGSASGTSSGAAVGKSIFSGVGAASGASGVFSTSRYKMSHPGTAVGTSTVVGIAPSVNTVITGENAAGTSTALAVGAARYAWYQLVDEFDTLDIIVRNIEETMVPTTQGAEYRSEREDL